VTSAVYYDLSGSVVPVTITFTDPSNHPVDPGTIQFVTTDPQGLQTNYTYTGGSGRNVITKLAIGEYQFNLQASVLYSPNPVPTGLWSAMWIGVGNTGGPGGTTVQANTFRILPYSSEPGTSQVQWYCGLDELKSRLSITDTASDYEMTTAIQAATNWITEYCAQHFFQITESRTFAPSDIWLLDIDPIVSVSSLLLDYDGDGTFETSWTQNVNYQLRRGFELYNSNYLGVPRPYRQVQVLLGSEGAPSGGQFFPFIWPFTHLDRIKITGVWGWPVIPPAVSQACLMLSAEYFKLKDATFGVLGVSDLGIAKVGSNSWIVELLRPYIRSNRKVGM
jgi:hypothetical protein